jgi:hypothetical protein
MIVTYSCDHPTVTHAEREVFTDFKILPGNIVMIDGNQTDIDSWTARHTVSLLPAATANNIVIAAEEVLRDSIVQNLNSQALAMQALTFTAQIPVLEEM